MKKCSKCEEEKELTEFGKEKNKPDGLKYSCKVCLNADRRAYHIKNIEKENNRDSSWYKENKDRAYSNCKSWRVKNKGLSNSYKARYRASKIQATPSWFDKDLVESLYVSASNGFHIDHIVPLQGELVCGLHVIENLQILSAEENLSKSNKFEVGIDD